jgi:uncharacterized protein (DUF1499 family)
VESSAAAEARALIERGSGPNVAATDESARDPRLHPRLLPLPLEPAAEALARAVAALPRWRVVARQGPVISATRTTRLFRFVDDVLVLLEPADGGTQVRARSASRVGRGDLGQNRRNLAELWRALGAE